MVRVRYPLFVMSTLLAGCASVPAGYVPRFSFHGIEFAPAETRLPAAEQFLRDEAAPGTSLSVAEIAMRRANAPCGKTIKPDGAITCRFSMVASNSFYEMPLGDIVWTVSLYPAADGTVARATVTREHFGN